MVWASKNQNQNSEKSAPEMPMSHIIRKYLRLNLMFQIAKSATAKRHAETKHIYGSV